MSKRATFPKRTVKRQGSGPHVRRGVSIMSNEDRMLQAIMRFDNPRIRNRSETIGNMIRTTYELLIRSGRIRPGATIPEEEYIGWADRWGIREPEEGQE